MKILLVYPEMPPTFWNMKFLSRMMGKKSNYPPLGLLTIAAMLPSQWEFKLTDINTKPLHKKDLLWADFVFIGAMSVQIETARAVVKKCKEAGVRIVAGGPLFIHEHHRFPEVDHFILNEAEITLPMFLKDLEKGQLQRIYSTSGFANIEETPIPRYDFVDLSKYSYAIIQYSRGCPFQCDFCDVTQLFGRKVRTKSGDQIVKELDALGSMKSFYMVLFADDNLIGHRSRLKNDLLPALIKWRREKNPPIGFATQVSIDLASDPEMMDLMLEAGFRHLFVGIETPEVDSLIAANKIQNSKLDLMKSVDTLHSKGFIVTGGFILGFDTDTPSVFERQIDFIRESGIVISTMNLLKAPGGTELCARMKREGRLLQSTDFDENTMNLVPKMDVRELYEGFGRVLDQVYLPEAVFERVKRFFEIFHGAQVANRINRKFHFQDILIFFRITFSIGLIGRDRKYYWKLILWAMKNYPRQVETVFLFIILLKQFHDLHTRFRLSEKSEIHQLFLREVSRQQQEIK